MNTEKMTPDQFALFIFGQTEIVKNYTFDLCHDIARITNYAYNPDNYRNEHGRIETTKPIKKTFYFFVRDTGTFLFEDGEDKRISHVEEQKYYTQKFKIILTPNHYYLLNESFAEVTTL